MAILPGVATLSSYGGPKLNYAPVEDPVTDEDADDRNNYAEDVACMTQTAVRGWCRFIGKASSPADSPATNVHGAVWGTDVAPIVTRTGTGVFVITWPTTWNDELGNAHTISIRGAHRPNVESSTLYHVQAAVTSANVVTVYVFNSAGAANDAVGVTISVSVW